MIDYRTLLFINIPLTVFFHHELQPEEACACKGDVGAFISSPGSKTTVRLRPANQPPSLPEGRR